MALIIAGDRSGAGKTTITLALLAYLKRQHLPVQSFKVGPDYIDPMFHQFVTEKPCRNLDPILTSEDYVKTCFFKHTRTINFALIEGVMGLFDGIPDGNSSLPTASTAHVAQLLNLPILLVIDCSRLSGSIAAIVHGFTTLNSGLKFAGCVLNRVGSDRHLELLQSALEPLNVPVLGALTRQAEITIPDRHLGLVPTDELPTLSSIFDQLAELAKVHFDWQKLLPLLKVESNSQLELDFNPESLILTRNSDIFSNNSFNNYFNSYSNKSFDQLPGKLPGQISGKQSSKNTNKALTHSWIRIGVAKDKAFNFYYADNFEVLQQVGAELIFWSPLDDAKVPENLHGLYFGGGFPEVFAEPLSHNTLVRQAIRRLIELGIPTYAECGGLMYLAQAITDFNLKSWPMVGILPTMAVMGERLKLGYYQATVLNDSPLLTAKTRVCGHQFHRSDLTRQPPQPLFELKRYNQEHISEREGCDRP
ncbi:MAG: cobyrinate a,c-diamide synthase [Oscillatoriales cyanobacterium RM1_1_9]|nr:cobyrinate a,c-diamide synthase [Oscillatoriales cyanobacterium RM1_1_9]